jgi:hypothetical protein
MKIIIRCLLSIFLIWGCNSTDHKKEKEYTAAQIDSLQKSQCDSILKNLNKTNADTFGTIKYIPADFDGCLKQLDSLTNDGLKEWIKCLPDREFGRHVHHSFGMYLRNNWGLWGDSPLAKNLSQLGIFHPDDMTAIILDSYQRKLKGEDIKLQEQLKHYQDFWRDKGIPVDSILQTLKNPKQNS